MSYVTEVVRLVIDIKSRSALCSTRHRRYVHKLSSTDPTDPGQIKKLVHGLAQLK